MIDQIYFYLIVYLRHHFEILVTYFRNLQICQIHVTGSRLGFAVIKYWNNKSNCLKHRNIGKKTNAKLRKHKNNFRVQILQGFTFYLTMYRSKIPNLDTLRFWIGLWKAHFHFQFFARRRGIWVSLTLAEIKKNHNN